jgi:Spy/CpxP family protein refolding chaperone
MQGSGTIMFGAVIGLLLLSAVPAAAQSSQGHQPQARPAANRPSPARPPQDRHKWWIGPQAKELGLSKDQSDKLEGIYQAALPRLESGGEDVRKSQQELWSRLVSTDKTTEVDVVRQLNQVQAARNELDRQMTLMLFRMYRELTPDQRVKAKALRDRRDQERREGRRGEPPQRPPIKK